MKQRTKITLISVVLIVTILACGINNTGVSEKPAPELTMTVESLQVEQGGRTSTSVGVFGSQTATDIVNTSVAETNTTAPARTDIPNRTFTPAPSSAVTITVSEDAGGLTTFETPATSTPLPAATLVSTATTVPTAKAGSPAAASNLSEQNICTQSSNPNGFYEVAGTLTWTDNSNNEMGFNIYQRLDGADSADVMVGSVGTDSTSINFSFRTIDKAPFSLKVEAYNNAGKAQMQAINIAFSCP